MDRMMFVVVAVLALSVFAVALVAGPGSEDGSASVLVEASSTGSVWESVPLSGPDVFYTSEVHEKVKDATEKGKAYDVVRGVEVTYTAGDFISPARPAFIADEPLCTFGFVLGSPGSYAITTAGHCVSVGEEVAMSLPEYPAALVAIGEVVDREDEYEVNDWALIEIKDKFQDHVFPGVLGSPTPRHGAFEVPDTVDGGLAAGSVWPMPVMMVSNNPSFGEDSPVPPLVTSVQTPLPGLLVEAYEGAYLCECPVTAGDSGGPVVVFDPGNPGGAALGLVSTRYERTDDFIDGVPGYVPTVPSKINVDYYEDRLRQDRGGHELAGVTPMPTVVAETGYPVATADPPSLDPPVGEPCVVKEAGAGENPLMCYSYLFDQWSPP